MSIYMKQNVVRDMPAVLFVEREKQNGAINVVAGEVLCDKHTLRGNWILGSVVSYALRYNECPIQAYQNAIDNGHETHYAFGGGACLTSGEYDKETRIVVEFGQLIRFEGRLFTIEKAPNNNIRLSPVVA